MSEASKLSVGAVHCPFFDNDGKCEHGASCLLQYVCRCSSSADLLRHVGSVSKGNWTLPGERVPRPDLSAGALAKQLIRQVSRVRAEPVLPRTRSVRLSELTR